MISFSEIESITRGKMLRLVSDRRVSSLVTDSRKTVNDPEAVFFAIQGSRHDAHQYIFQAYESGVRQFVVEREIPAIQQMVDANILLVKSSLTALQALAIFKRKQFSKQVIGITGSNGKTIVKEWLYQLLSPDLNIAKNPGSYNSQLGVPLSVWQLENSHDLGIFEAGISKPGEMTRLEEIIQPNIGIFTNIGSAHDEGFSSRSQKIEEKLKLFANTSLLIFCSQHNEIASAVSKRSLRTLTWGFDDNAAVQLRHQNSSVYLVSHKGTQFEINLPFADPASVENCFHCVTLLLHLKYSPQLIQERVRMLRAVPMRLELKEGINQSLVIDDTYNNDLAGLKISLEYLANQHQKTKKRVILSDILEAGISAANMAKDVANVLHTFNIQNFIGIGPLLSQHKNVFDASAQFFPSTESFINSFDFDSIGHEIVLIKGARIFAFEKIVERLQKKVHGTVMEIDLDALVKNLNYFRGLLNPITKIMVMVKAFAYGSGSNEVANLLQYHRVDYLGVAYADEGIELRRNNITLPIMVMNPTEEAFDALLLYHLEPEIYGFRILNSLIKFLGKRACVIHIKIDTGMHRLGFDANDIPELVNLLLVNPNIRVASIFSHLAGADEPQHDAFSTEQATLFQKTAAVISQGLGYRPLFHVLNSPGILRLRQFQFDMVRLGIGLYGVNPTAEPVGGLTPVPTLKTIISQTRKIHAGETVGYGRRGIAERDLEIATIAIGYADGYSRAFSRGVGKVLVNGRLAPVIGNVCMDMTMIDVTGLDAKEGDEAIIFGKDLPIQDVATSIGTIPYEILTSTSERVKRLFVAESI